jgi:hypothetical protein
LAISSSQNIVGFTLYGKETWKVYRAAPGVSVVDKIALVVLAVASTAMMAANSYQAGYAAAGGGVVAPQRGNT